MIRERETKPLPGVPVLLVLIAATGLSIWGGISAADNEAVGLLIICLLAGLLSVFLMAGRLRGQPQRGEGAAVLRRLRRHGRRTPGLRWANPFYTKKSVSLRVRNFESAKLKVNDNDGNPIEIAAVVVWRVVDTAEAVFEVDDYNNYVQVQSESALRNLATSYPYDAHDDHTMSLRGTTQAVADHLKREIQDRLHARRRRGDGGAHQPPRLRAGDRPRDAAAPAGRRDHRRPPADRRRGGRHGGDGARDAEQARDRRRSTTSARRRW